MNLIGMFILALGLSMDAFAIAIGKGLSLSKVNLRNALIVGAYFGGFQVIMPLIGYFAATYFTGITSFDYLIAFALLTILGVRMIIESFREEGSEGEGDGKASLSPVHMIPLSLACSIDALAVGVSFAFIEIDVILAVIIIGIVTFVMSMIGVKAGRTFGDRIGSRAELLGGMILIAIGLQILLEGLGIINF